MIMEARQVVVLGGRFSLRGWAAARGASYVSLGNDLSDVNYSSAQVGIIAERETL